MAKSTPARVLCIDVGNTSVKAAVGDGRRWTRFAPVSTAAFGRAAPWQPRGVNGVVAVVVSSVVPSANPRVARVAARATGLPALFVDHSWPFPFRLAVSSPVSVGVDRLCAAAGAVRSGARSAIVVDVGSAITVDLVSGGAYRGGMIMAGPQLGLWALGRYAEKLPAIDFSRVQRPFSRRLRGTDASMILGAAHGSVGAVKEAVAALRRTSSARPRVFITGGGSASLRARLPRSWIHRPNLVLEGLCEVGHRRINRGTV
jgi:type III pantothenate kinase